METTMEIGEELARARKELAAARHAETAARDRARLLAAEAIAAGYSEHRAARALGVDRMTIRKWLDK